MLGFIHSKHSEIKGIEAEDDEDEEDDDDDDLLSPDELIDSDEEEDADDDVGVLVLDKLDCPCFCCCGCDASVRIGAVSSAVSLTLECIEVGDEMNNEEDEAMC